MRLVSLNEILGPEQLDQVVKILKSGTNEIAVTRNLRVYYHTLSEMLEAQDILPDYLAYATAYAYFHSEWVTPVEMIEKLTLKKGGNQ